MVWRYFKQKKGLTITETIMTAFITLMAAACLFQAFYYGMAFLERQAHRRMALSIANEQMVKWQVLFSQRGSKRGNFKIPGQDVRCVIDEGDPETNSDDLNGFIRISQPIRMRENFPGIGPVEAYYKLWVRVYWYENPSNNNEAKDMEQIQLVTYFPIHPGDIREIE